jgi:hypothetical protein
VIAAAQATSLANSFATYWPIWLLVVAMVTLRVVIELVDRRRVNAAPAVRTYVRASTSRDSAR